jgi:hypothetical protein
MSTRPAPGREPEPVASVTVEISPGELIDKLTILEIKAARITDHEKLANVRYEYALLEMARDRKIPASAALDRLVADLGAVNAKLWDIEDELCDCERAGRFDERFVGLARSVYRTNDRRAAIKGEINRLLGATIVEEISYTEY